MILAPRLTLNDARIVLEGAEAKARQIAVDMDIAVVDDGGHLIAFVRMDNARVTSIDVAINKAFTAACARRSATRTSRRSSSSATAPKRWPTPPTGSRRPRR